MECSYDLVCRLQYVELQKISAKYPKTLSMLILKRYSSDSEEDKLMWDYCTPGPEALERKVTTTHNFQIFDIILHDLTLFYTVLHHRTIMPSLSGSITKTFQHK